MPTARLLSLSPVDLLVIIIYFVFVLAIGFYLKRYTSTSEDFFMAGREMTAWVAGLSFLAANLGSLELMGWAAAAYQYGILATHWYWIGAIPASSSTLMNMKLAPQISASSSSCAGQPSRTPGRPRSASCRRGARARAPRRP